MVRGRCPYGTLFPYTTLFRSIERGHPSGRAWMEEVRRGGLPDRGPHAVGERSEEHTSELQSHVNLVCRLPREKKNPRRAPLGRVASRSTLRDADLLRARHFGGFLW